MKRKLMSLLLAVTMVCMVGCGAKDSQDSNQATENNVVESTTPNATPEASPEATPEATPEVSPEATPEVTPEVTPDAGGNATESGDSMGTSLGALFEEQIANTQDMEAVANALCESIQDWGCMVTEVQEGFLMGFSQDITGFQKGYCFAPMIGTIPLIGYIFETDDPAALEALVTASADPRWNICTEAAETVIKVSGNYVFITMCPGEDF